MKILTLGTFSSPQPTSGKFPWASHILTEAPNPSQMMAEFLAAGMDPSTYDHVWPELRFFDTDARRNVDILSALDSLLRKGLRPKNWPPVGRAKVGMSTWPTVQSQWFDSCFVNGQPEAESAISYFDLIVKYVDRESLVGALKTGLRDRRLASGPVATSEYIRRMRQLAQSAVDTGPPHSIGGHPINAAMSKSAVEGREKDLKKWTACLPLADHIDSYLAKQSNP
jgi:hypothetical protein